MNDESGESMEPKEEVPLKGQCVCVCYKAATFAAAADDLASAFTRFSTSTVRSVCAIFLSTRNCSDFYPRDAVLARY